MKKYFKFFISFLLIVILTIISYSENKYNIPGLNNKIYNNLCGVWNISTKYETGNKKFSWGYSKYIPNSSIVIDFYSNNVESGTGFGSLTILFVKEIEENKYSLQLKVPEGHEVNIILDYVKTNEINLTDKNGIFDNGTYYKIGGPDIKFDEFYMPKTNLHLREDAKLDSKPIRLLKKGEKLVILMRDNNEIEINGVKGNWVQIESLDKSDIGWCFDAYLEEVKKK